MKTGLVAKIKTEVTMLKRIVLMLCLCAVVFGKEWPIYKIGIHENVPYLEKGRNELLDVYYPADAKPDEKFPGIVIIHGGGWTGGQRKEPFHRGSLQRLQAVNPA